MININNSDNKKNILCKSKYYRVECLRLSLLYYVDSARLNIFLYLDFYLTLCAKSIIFILNPMG